ncbi:MAG: glycosyl hydrolase [Bacteroidales bacterium]
MAMRLILIAAIFIVIVPRTQLSGQENSSRLMKGLAYRHLGAPEGRCSDIDKLNISWYYNWTPEPGCPVMEGVEFIPMIWSDKYLVGDNYRKFLEPLTGSGHPALLGFNEPNWKGQAEMSVEMALECWPMLERTGLRLGSPATTGRSGLDWSIEFLKGLKKLGYRVDFLALHWYGDCSNMEDLRSFLDYYSAFDMPMWLTEFSCFKQDMETNASFLEQVVPLLENYPNLERYAWYSNRTTEETYAGAALVNPSGTPTPAGEIFRKLPVSGQHNTDQPEAPDLELEIIDWHDGPVIRKGDPGTVDIKHGFEGGRVIRQEGWYHLFTSEQAGDPKWVKMRLAHWKSRDGVKWERVSTLYESSGDFTGTDPRAALWSPMPVFNEEDSTWYMTYVAYRCAPNTRDQFLNNFGGRIIQARSLVKGTGGLGGPYRDIAVIQEPGPLADEWEGLQGSDSFFPFKLGNKWLAFTGSAKTEKLPMEFWGNGLALAPSLTGPWIRLTRRSPVEFGTNFSENPIVTQLPDGTLVAVMDSHGSGFGYSVSTDGLKWSPMKYVVVTDKLGKWWAEFRTPLGLVPEEDGTFTLFFTVMKEPTDYWDHLGEEGYVLDTGFDSVGKMTLRIH